MKTLLNNNWDILKSYVDKHNTILLSTHINPDGDGLGSEIAFYYYLRDLGKTCRIINVSPVPSNYKRIDPDNVIELYDNLRRYRADIQFYNQKILFGCWYSQNRYLGMLNDIINVS